MRTLNESEKLCPGMTIAVKSVLVRQVWGGLHMLGPGRGCVDGLTTEILTLADRSFPVRRPFVHAQRGDYGLDNLGATSVQLLNRASTSLVELLAAMAALRQVAPTTPPLPTADGATLVSSAAAAIMAATAQNDTLKAILLVAAFVSFALAKGSRHGLNDDEVRRVGVFCLFPAAVGKWRPFVSRWTS